METKKPMHIGAIVVMQQTISTCLLQVARQCLHPWTVWWQSRVASWSNPAWSSIVCWNTVQQRRPCPPSAQRPVWSAWRPRIPCSTIGPFEFANVSAGLAGRNTASGSTGLWDLQVGFYHRHPYVCGLLVQWKCDDSIYILIWYDSSMLF